MGKPLLRTKNGCIRCRIRKKKCDEQRPTCASCARLNLSCDYGDGKVSVGPSKHQKIVFPIEHVLQSCELVPRSHNDLGIGKTVTGSGYLSFRDSDQFVLIGQSSDTYATLITPAAAEGRHDTRVLVTLVLENAWARDAIAAFTATMLASKQPSNGHLTRLSLTFYHAALTQLKNAIGSGLIKSDSLALLMSVTFLGLFESLGTGSVSLAVPHFLAAARLSPLVSNQNSASAVFLRRIAIECWLYNLSTLAIYFPDCQRIIDSINWKAVEEVFYDENRQPLPYQVSPHLAGFHEIYRLIVHVTWLGRQGPSSNGHSLLIQIKILRGRLDSLEARLDYHYQDLPHGFDRVCQMRILSMILAVRIFLLKIENSSRCSSDPIIKDLTLRAKDSIKLCTHTHPANAVGLAWQLTIFLFAADDHDTFDFFRQTISYIQNNLDTGHRERLGSILMVVGELRRNPHCEEGEACDRQHDGLGLLLLKEGVLSQSPMHSARI